MIAVADEQMRLLYPELPQIYCIKCKTGFEFNASYKASSQGHW